MNVNDFNRAITAEDLIRRYGLNTLKKDMKSISKINYNLTKRYNIIENFVTYISPYKGQTEKITVWFLNGIPTLENEPYISLTLEEKNDVQLYFDKETGIVYKLDTENWLEISDENLIKVLSIANSDADTNDGNRRVFFKTPIPPYDIGDVWINNDEIMRCRYFKTEGEFEDNDWVSKENYSDEFVLNEIRKIKSDITEIKKQLEKELEPKTGTIKLKGENDNVIEITISDGLIVDWSEVV